MAALVSLVGFKATCPDKLQGTLWRGKAMIPTPTDVILKFSDKGLLFYDGSQPTHRLGLAICGFQDGSFVEIRPQSGLSACPTHEPWLYNIREDTNGLNVVLIAGPCECKGSILTSDV